MDRQEKLYNPFNDAGMMEVCIKDVWYRVTSKDFRSFSGPRRITSEDYVVHGLSQLDATTTTKDYDGPVFYMESNFVYEGDVLNKLVYLDENN